MASCELARMHEGGEAKSASVVGVLKPVGHVSIPVSSQMLLHRGASSFLRRSPVLIRSMSSTSVFILPIDPKSQVSTRAVPDIDPVKLWSTTPVGSKAPKVGSTRVFYNTPAKEGINVTTVVSLGEGFDKKQGNARRELVRKAVGSGVKQVKDLGDGTKKVSVDASTDPHAAGMLL